MEGWQCCQQFSAFWQVEKRACDSNDFDVNNYVGFFSGYFLMFRDASKPVGSSRVIWKVGFFLIISVYLSRCCWYCHGCLCIRVLHSTEPTAFHGLFLYLEDRFIMKDKSEMWKCTRVVAQKAFEMFLCVKAEKVMSNICQFLSQNLLQFVWYFISVTSFFRYD